MHEATIKPFSVALTVTLPDVALTPNVAATVELQSGPVRSSQVPLGRFIQFSPEGQEGTNSDALPTETSAKDAVAHMITRRLNILRYI